MKLTFTLLTVITLQVSASSFAENITLKADEISLKSSFNEIHNPTHSETNNEVDITITGVVLDEQGLPLPGVSVTEKNKSNGTVTNLDGQYTINVSSESVLVFRFLGFITEEIPVGNKSVINLQMKPSATNLDEITVVAYGQQKKVTITGAISSISSADLVKSPLANVANSLAGKVTGLSTVQSSGQPGADNPEIFVRGITSLSTARSQPLMIVDGVERSFMSLDPNEIDNISILKDASATAVYGVRGANGVIIVTTKRGTIGKPKISVSFSSGIQQPTQLLKWQSKVLF